MLLMVALTFSSVKKLIWPKHSLVLKILVTLLSTSQESSPFKTRYMVFP